jgi:hypothetical protein
MNKRGPFACDTIREMRTCIPASFSSRYSALQFLKPIEDSLIGAGAVSPVPAALTFGAGALRPDLSRGTPWCGNPQNGAEISNEGSEIFSNRAAQPITLLLLK